MTRGIIILGSTGSIGTQTLQVIEQFPANLTWSDFPPTVILTL